jgi:hypothetical protein
VFYVYLIESRLPARERYVGLTTDLNNVSPSTMPEGRATPLHTDRGD